MKIALKLTLLVWLMCALQTGALATPPLRYNEVSQRSLHNAYAASAPLFDQLAYHRIRNIELDIHSESPCPICGPTLNTNDWFVYHTVLEPRSCHTLSGCLKMVRAFHDAFPAHEAVTLFLELKGNYDGTSCAKAFANPNQSPEGLDALVRSYLGDALVTPRDLMNRCPEAKTLHEAVTRCGWPTLDELRGKALVALIGWGRNEPSLLQDYAQLASGPQTALNRALFLAPLFLWRQDETLRAFPNVLFHVEANDDARAEALRTHFPWLILRSGDADEGQGQRFLSLRKRAQLVMSDAFNWHTLPEAQRAAALPATPLYPFSPAAAAPTESLQAFELKSRSLDISGTADHFAYAHFTPQSLPDNASTWSLSAALSGPGDRSVNADAKGCLMARAALTEDAAYWAVCRTARGGLFVQYRPSNCQDRRGQRVTCGTTRIAATYEQPGLAARNAAFVKLVVQRGSEAGARVVQGFGSYDGKAWFEIGAAARVATALPYLGLAVSSKEKKGYPDGAPLSFVFGRVRLNEKLNEGLNERLPQLQDFAVTPIGQTDIALLSPF